MDENGQQRVDAVREHDADVARVLEVKRKEQVAGFWKAIVILIGIVGTLSGFLISDLRYMSIISENTAKIESVSKQVDFLVTIHMGQK